MPKIALVQFCPESPSISLEHPSSSSQDESELAHTANLEKAHRFVRQAKEQGAELVCFPEYFLSGVVSDRQHWTLSQYPPHSSHLHDDHPSISSSPASTTTHWLSTFQSLARELDIDIAVGTIVERQIDPTTGLEATIEIDGEERMILNNVAYYVDNKGEVRGRYVKKNLWWPEKEYLTEGREEERQEVFETRFGKTSFLICWDLAHGESFLPLLEQSVDLIICPTYWTGSDGGEEAKKWDRDSEKKWLETLIVSRAFENECAIVFVNVGSPAGKDETDFDTVNPEERIGCSAVCLPFRGKIGGTKSAEEEMVVIDTDLSVLPDARSVYGMRRGLMDRKKARGGKV
ncbi:carbon-nitrogen hydrolase family protein [Sporobolomyces salmoneus]|uniref:carbon-nitrogen hydrolase family protein n=1 Tax=Sporobolomyces salmoneus TaxID=183962 RepID=UPI00318155F1